MDKIMAMREKRAEMWEQAKQFLDSHEKDGRLTAEDAKAYEQMENEVLALGKDIERMERQAILDAQLAKPVTAAITNTPGAGLSSEKTGRASEGYRSAMLRALRTNFRQMENVLQEGTDASGGYLVPEEYDKRLIDVLDEENVLRPIATVITTSGEQIHKVNEHAEANSWLVKNHPVASPLIAIPFLGGTVLDALYGDEYKQYQEQQKIAKEKAAAEESARAEVEKNAKAQEQNAKAAKIRAAAEKDAAKTVSESAKATAQLTDNLYTLTHTDIQNSLHALDRESFEFFRKGADPHLIDEYRLAKEAKIYVDFQRDVVDKANALYKTDLQNKLDSIAREADAFRQKGLDEVQTQNWLSESKARVMEQWERDVASNIDSIWKTELENRLAEIEREKDAWVQKGLDEVEATRWAEKEKLDAKRNAALEVLRSQKEELQVFKKSGQVGLMEYLRKKNKFTAEDLGLTPELLQQFQSGRKWAMENLLPNFAPEKREDSSRIRVNGQEFSYAQMMAGLGQQAQSIKTAGQSASQQSIQSTPSMTDNRQIHIQVQIENAVTEDNEGMRMLADHVADRIRPAVENALGGDSNSYSHW